MATGSKLAQGGRRGRSSLAAGVLLVLALAVGACTPVVVPDPLPSDRFELPPAAPMSITTTKVAGVTVDVHEPFRNVRGTIIFVHGGGFIFGDRTAMSPAVRAQVGDGWRVVSVEYRYGAGAPYPAAVLDVQAVVDSAPSTWSGPTVLWGFSAGGSVALLAADGTEVDAVVAQSAIWDFRAPATARFGFFWGAPLVTIPNPNEVAVDEPVYQVHGTADPEVPYNQALAAARFHCSTFDIIEDGGHNSSSGMNATALREWLDTNAAPAA